MCLDYDSVIGLEQPFTYQNLLSFSNYYSLDTIMMFYWMLTAMSVFSIVALPFQIMIGYALWGYTFFMDVKNFINSWAFWTRNTEQSLRLAPWYWFLESFLLWDVGTFLVVNSMILNSFVPIAGALVNGIITILMYAIIFG